MPSKWNNRQTDKAGTKKNSLLHRDVRVRSHQLDIEKGERKTISQVVMSAPLSLFLLRKHFITELFFKKNPAK